MERDDIERTWGWDEAFQQDAFRSFVEVGTWRVVEIGGQNAGALAVSEEPDALQLIYLFGPAPLRQHQAALRSPQPFASITTTRLRPHDMTPGPLQAPA